MSVWRKNLFKVHTGHSGKEFINEMTKEITLWTSKSPLRKVSLNILMVLPNLLLQITSIKSSTSDNKRTLERRLVLWKEKKITELIGECLVIQSRLKNGHQRQQDDMPKQFNNFMMKD